MRLLPREEEFFSLFTEVANRNKEAVEHLRKLFEASPERRTPHIEAIKRLEHEADQVTHEVVNRLDRTFITPLDREDIHQLSSDLDDVMDAMDGTARRAQAGDTVRFFARVCAQRPNTSARRHDGAGTANGAH